MRVRLFLTPRQQRMSGIALPFDNEAGAGHR
jgi:hypothetical protein